MVEGCGKQVDTRRTESEVTDLSATSEYSESTMSMPIGPFVHEQILTRLREALQLATESLPGRLDRFRDLLTDVLERVDSIELTRLGNGTQRPAQPLSRLRCAAFSVAGGEPVREFLLIPFGEVVVERPVAGESFVFTRAHAESAKRWFDQMSRKLAVDYEHQSFDRFNTRSDGLRPAAGWIGGVEIREDGLWAVDVTWTDRAKELLRTGEYRYFSPVIFWTDEDHTDVAALGPVALTNDPAMRGVRPLAANRGLDPPEPEDGAVEAEGEREEGVSLLEDRLAAAQAEICVLRQRLAAQEADTFVERGLRLGKILDSTSMDWRADYLRDAEAAEEKLARAPVVLPPGRLLALDRSGDVPRQPRSLAIRPSGPSPTGRLAVESEDLAAYERALAAGRVRATGR
jgi:hypothetical protein